MQIYIKNCKIVFKNNFYFFLKHLLFFKNILTNIAVHKNTIIINLKKNKIMDKYLRLVKESQKAGFKITISDCVKNNIIPIVIIDSNSITIDTSVEEKIFDLKEEVSFEFESQKSQFAFEHLLLEKEACLNILDNFENYAYTLGYETNELFFKVEFSNAYGFELRISLCNKYGEINSTNAHYYRKVSGGKTKSLNQKIEEFLSM